MCVPNTLALRFKTLNASKKNKAVVKKKSDPILDPKITKDDIAAAGLRGSRHDRFDGRDARISGQDDLGFDPKVSQNSLLGM